MHEKQMRMLIMLGTLSAVIGGSLHFAGIYLEFTQSSPKLMTLKLLGIGAILLGVFLMLIGIMRLLMMPHKLTDICPQCMETMQKSKEG